MKYLFTLVLWLSIHYAQAHVQLLMSGVRLATSTAILAAQSKKDKAATAAEPAVPGAATSTPAAATLHVVTPFQYQGQTVSRQRTSADKLKGKGAPEILALEASLEQSHAALLADSVHSFMPATQYDAIIAAARKAAAARPNWDYSPYQQELAFYQKEEARRQQAAQPTPTK